MFRELGDADEARRDYLMQNAAAGFVESRVAVRRARAEDRREKFIFVPHVPDEKFERRERHGLHAERAGERRAVGYPSPDASVISGACAERD